MSKLNFQLLNNDHIEEESKNHDHRILSHESVSKDENKDAVKNINDLMSHEILKMMNEVSLSSILDKIKQKYGEESLNDIDQDLEHANLFKDEEG